MRCERSWNVRALLALELLSVACSAKPYNQTAGSSTPVGGTDVPVRTVAPVQPNPAEVGAPPAPSSPDRAPPLTGSGGSPAPRMEAQAGAGNRVVPATSAATAGSETLAGRSFAQRYPGAPPEVVRSETDWPLPNSDYDNTRNAHTRIDSRNVSQLREIWRLPLPASGVFGSITSNPLVLGDRVYLHDMQSNVLAIARDTGKQLWQQVFNAATLGPNGVAVGWGKVFAASSDTSIAALDAVTGEIRWTYQPQGSPAGSIGIQPTVYDGLVLVATVPGSISKGYEAGVIGRLIALDAETGRERWSFDTVDSKDIWGNPKLNNGGGAWYPPLIAPDLSLSFWGTGNPAPAPGTPEQPLGASRPGPNLYTNCVVALGLPDGKLSWFWQDKPHDLFDWDFQASPVRVRAADRSGADIVIGAGKTGHVAALLAQDGKLLWRTNVGTHQNDELTEYPRQSIEIYPGGVGGVVSAIAFADGVVYAASVDLPMTFDGVTLTTSYSGGKGHLTAIDAISGEVRWKAELRGAAFAAATVANDLVFTADENGHVYAFQRDTGKTVWEFDAPERINAPLVITGDDLFISAGAGFNGAVLRLGLSGK